MARTFSNEFLQKKAEPQSTVLEIWDVHLGSTSAVDANTLFFVVTNKNIKFFSAVDSSPQIYIGLGISRSPIARHIDSKIDAVDISLDNVDRTFSQYFLSVDLRGKRIIIRKVFADLLNSPTGTGGNNFATMFDGIIDTPILNQSRATAQLKNNFFQSLAFRVPRRTYQGLCNYRFGNSGDCAAHQTQQQLFNTQTGQTVKSVPSQVHFTDTARSEGASGDYWAPGIIKMTGGTSGNIGIFRRIVQSTATGDIFLESNFPYTVVSGDVYQIQRDCGHTLDKDCRDRFQNNSEFGGFTTIPENLTRHE